MKIIIALDYPTQSQAFELISFLNPTDFALKVGLEMFTRFGPDFVSALVDLGYRVFLDLKYHDIPNTVAKAMVAAAQLNVWMVDLHASGGLAMMRAAKAALTDGERVSNNADNSFAKRKRPLVVAVTVLTSDPQSTGLEQRVVDYALLAQAAGLDGVVCSAFELPFVKAACGPSFLTVTPGIRLPTDSQDDQSRVMTPAQALARGADYLVIGRSITQSKDPAQAIRRLFD